MTQAERGSLTGALESRLLDAAPDLHGLRHLLARDYDINNNLRQLKESIRRQRQERQLQGIEEARARAAATGPAKLKKSVVVPTSMTSAAQLDELIRQLQELRQQMTLGAEIELSFTIQE